MAFSFGFSGDDIDVDPNTTTSEPPSVPKPSQAPAFPVPGKPQLAPTAHSLSSLLATLPSKIAYDFLDVDLDDGTRLRLPRRELWDVRVQLMAEEEDGAEEAAEGLGKHDVKTGVYEGGFKSWESSVDLVKTLATDQQLFSGEQSQPLRVIEVSNDIWLFYTTTKQDCLTIESTAWLRNCIALPCAVPMGSQSKRLVLQDALLTRGV